MLVAAELTAAAATLRSASRTLHSRIHATTSHHRALADSGFSGEAPEAGLGRLDRLGQAFSGPAGRFSAVADVLEQAADAQATLDAARAVVEGAMATSPQLVLIHRSALAGLNIAGRMLDQACAAAVADACMLEHEADLDRLIFHPEEPVHSIHARHLATAPASAREAIEQAGGLILESGPSGHTVMVGDQVDPSSVTTMVAGVSSGDPAKLGLQLEQARAVAVATGGAVIVWQGYSPPPTLIDGISPSSAAAGADDLSAFQMALNERFPEARKLVVGHSYGSVVSALAAEDGLFADELVLVGSPGVASISDLNLLSEDPHVTVADSPTDPILALRSPLVSAHGVDPASPWFGAERIEGIRGNHTDYFYDPAFLAGIAERARR